MYKVFSKQVDQLNGHCGRIQRFALTKVFVFKLQPSMSSSLKNRSHVDGCYR